MFKFLNKKSRHLCPSSVGFIRERRRPFDSRLISKFSKYVLINAGGKHFRFPSQRVFTRATRKSVSWSDSATAGQSEYCASNLSFDKKNKFTVLIGM